jgi:CHAD domain-containing protein
MTGRHGGKRARDDPGDLVALAIGRGLAAMARGERRIRLEADARSVKRTRVATRRIRSDLGTFGAGLDPAWVGQVRAELRWLSAALADVRDADVLSARLKHHALDWSPLERRPLADLVGHLAEERQDALDHLRRVLRSDRYRALRDELEEAATSGPPRDRGGRQGGRRPSPSPPRTQVRRRKQVRRDLRRSWRRLRRTVSGLGADPTNEQLHRVRIRTKQFRYALEAAGPLAGARGPRLVGAAVALQDCLGELSDADGAEWWFRGVWSSGTPAAAFAAGRCAAGERAAQETARRRWPQRWADLRHEARRQGW